LGEVKIKTEQGAGLEGANSQLSTLNIQVAEKGKLFRKKGTLGHRVSGGTELSDGRDRKLGEIRIIEEREE
jgi:hypothetical protein